MAEQALPPPADAQPEVHRLMVASEGRPIPYQVLQRAMELARPHTAPIFVVSIARVWGSSLGFPNPWLQPSQAEWAVQREIVQTAVSAFEKAGFESSGVVLATRRPGKRIRQEAERRSMDAIVMGCDAPRRYLVSDFIWSQEPYRVARRAKLPVVLVRLDDGSATPV